MKSLMISMLALIPVVIAQQQLDPLRDLGSTALSEPAVPYTNPMPQNAPILIDPMPCPASPAAK